MSIIIATGSVISNSPLNTSKSKQLYSFPKSVRFPSIKASGYADKYYDLPEVGMKRKAGLGYGKRSDFTQGGKGINTQFYDNGTDFDQKHPHSPSFTFGIGRDKYEKVYYESNKMLDKNIPGPGKYNYLKAFGYEAPKFSMKGKNDEGIEGKKGRNKNISPGPGQYPVTIQIKNGKYPLSSIANIPSFNFANDKEKRFNYRYNKHPGPSDYIQKELIGKIFNSKFRSSEGKSMFGRYKEKDSRIGNPGPGAYVCFSEFGIYGSKNAQTEPNQESKKEPKNEEEKTVKKEPPREKTEKKVVPKPRKKEKNVEPKQPHKEKNEEPEPKNENENNEEKNENENNEEKNENENEEEKNENEKEKNENENENEKEENENGKEKNENENENEKGKNENENEKKEEKNEEEKKEINA